MNVKVIREGKQVEVSHTEATPEEMQAHLDAQITTARKSEKDKVYETINTLKTEKQTISTQLQEANQKLQQVSTPNQPQTTPNQVTEPTTAAAQQHQQPQQTTSPNTIPSDLVEKVIAGMTEKVIVPMQNRIAELAAQVTNTQQETVADYRQRRLSELGDSVIPEIVSGNSREEIEQSINKAKEVRAKYSTTPTPPATTTPPAGGASAATTTTPPAGGGSPENPLGIPTNRVIPPSPPLMPDPNNPNAVLDYSKMSPAEYAQHRNKILAENGATASQGGSFK